MKKVLRTTNSLLRLMGIDLAQTATLLSGLPWFLRDLRKLLQQRRSAPLTFRFAKLYPCLSDRHDAGGAASGHYFHQDLLIARRIFETQPECHVDVGSRVDGFVAHVASFRPLKVIDIRANPSSVPNVEFIRADLMSPLPANLLQCCDSLSCLHALEHFGLGRYGDAVNYDGHVFGLRNLRELLKKDGLLFLSVPIGPQRIEFNAHRVFSVPYLLQLFEGMFTLERLSYVDDAGALFENVDVRGEGVKHNFGCNYGCGIFELRRL